MRSSLPPAAVLLLAFVLMLPAVSLALSSSKVTLNFMCPCGTCDEALSTCECPSSDGYRSQIAGMVGRGYSEEQIIQNFKGQFGPSVLITNAALAPNSGGLVSKATNKKTIGYIFLFGSFGLIAFSLGKYMKAAPSPAPARRKKNRSSGAPGKQAKGQGKRKNRPQKGFDDDVDDDLLDDYNYK